MQIEDCRMQNRRPGDLPGFLFCILHFSVCISLTGCGNADTGDRLVILSPHRDEIRREVARAFAAWHADRHPDAAPVVVIWQDVGGGTAQIAKFIESQYGVSPDGIGVDLLFGGGTDLYLRFAPRGYLARIDLPRELFADGRIPPQLNGIPLYDPGGRWYGAMLSSFGILSNRRVLERIGQPVPRRWEDLGEPALYRWVGAGDPRMTGSVHLVCEIILQRDGFDRGLRLLLRIVANARGIIRDSGTLTRIVSEGEVAAAGNIDVNALSAVGRDPDGMTFVLPASATVISPDSVAVLKGAPKPALAREFIEYLLSDAGQELFLLNPGLPGGPLQDPLCRLSVVPALYRRFPPPKRSVGAADPFTLGGAFDYKASVGQARWDALNDLLGAIALDAQAELSDAWHTVIDAPLSAERRRQLEGELFRPPCTEVELADYGKRIAVESPRYRAETVNRWGENARRHYREVAKEARGE
jgi:ABC-type Fe3+ transport system substrate-binding protein